MTLKMLANMLSAYYARARKIDAVYTDNTSILSYNNEKLEEYIGNLLLVGINYDKKSKMHYCEIETYENSRIEGDKLYE